jgi:hypothetical protein
MFRRCGIRFADRGMRQRCSLREISNRTSEGFGMRDYRDAVARLGQ